MLNASEDSPVISTTTGGNEFPEWLPQCCLTSRVFLRRENIKKSIFIGENWYQPQLVRRISDPFTVSKSLRMSEHFLDASDLGMSPDRPLGGVGDRFKHHT